MASSSKRKSKSKSSAKKTSNTDVVDAVVVEDTDAENAMETVDEMAAADGLKDTAVEIVDEDLVEEELVEEDLGEDVADLERLDGESPGDDTSADDTVIDDAASDETVSKDTDGDIDDDGRDVVEQITDPVPVAAAPVKRSSPFWALLLGGVVAAGMGFVLARYLVPEGWPLANSGELEAKVEAQAETIEAQTATIEGLTAQIGEAASETENLNATAENLASELTEQSEQIAALEAQIAELSKPVAVASEAELSADLTALIEQQKEELAALQGDLKSMASFAEEQIASAQEEADAAERAEARAKARDALNTVRLALASGDGFEDALPEIAGATEVPAALSDVASGIPTQSELQSSYGAAARAALAASNRELAGDSASDRVGLFFQDMIGARSLTPQEGDSPDAVLSRVEAAVQNGDLAAALETIEALPESGKSELTEWSEKAKARNDALQAFSDLTDALSAD